MIIICKLKRITVFFRILLFTIIICCISISSLTAENITIKVGVYNNEPLLFMDEQGNAKGLFADLIEYIAKEENWKIEYEFGTWDDCLSRLKDNRIDILPTIAYSDERAKLYDFNSETVFTNWGEMYVPKRSDIFSIMDVSDIKIAVLKNDIHYKSFMHILDSFGIRCDFLELNSYDEVFQSVSEGTAQAGIVNHFYGMRSSNGYNVKKSSVDFNPLKIMFSFSKNTELTQYLIQKIDQQIIKLKKDTNSIYYNSMDKYLGNINKLTIFPLWIKITIAIILTFAIIFFIFIMILKSQVKQRTQELKRDISERIKLEKSLQESENKYRSLAETSSDLIITLDQDGKLTYISPASEKITGYCLQEFIGRPFIDILSPEYVESTIENFKKGLIGKKIPLYEVEIFHKNGRRIPVELHASNLFDGGGKVVGRIIVVRDITERKLADDRVKKDLKIKTALIQEIYHRTRNNMAVISAMLSMQSSRSENENVKSTLREINNKIQAMSLVHQKLFKAKDLSNINLKDYIVDLANLIFQSYGAFSERVKMKFDLQDVKILIDTAVPLGLIINELLSNVFKHAFPENQEGKIFIRLFKEEDATINIELIDNGVGFPQNFDPRKDGSMGLITVFSIAENQLQGEISVKCENGLKWNIKIKDNLHKERV